MKKTVSNYINSRNAILKSFQCEQDFYVKPIEGCKWAVRENDGAFFLNYWHDGKGVRECFIVKKDGLPYVIREKDYTMIVCIECVKVAIIAANSDEVYDYEGK